MTNKQRKAIYKRDGYACGCCGSKKQLQIHHVIKRSQGGGDHPHNLVTLCGWCHALVHNTILDPDTNITTIDAEYHTVEYLADMYVGWEPLGIWKGWMPDEENQVNIDLMWKELENFLKEREGGCF